MLLRRHARAVFVIPDQFSQEINLAQLQRRHPNVLIHHRVQLLSLGACVFFTIEAP